MGWSEIFAALTDKKDLSNDQVTWGMSQILEGAASNEDIKAFLTGLKAKGERIQTDIKKSSKIDAQVLSWFTFSSLLSLEFFSSILSKA